MEITSAPKSSKKTVSRKTLRYYIYIANLLLSLHYSLIIYINSSFLLKFFTNKELGFLYIWGSILNGIILIMSAKILRKLSLRSFLIIFAILELLSVLVFITSASVALIGFFFIIHQASVFMMLFSMDIYLEEMTEDESETGGVRSLYLTLFNMMLVISPALVAIILIEEEYWRVYLASALVIVPLILLIRIFLPKLKIKYEKTETKIIDGLKTVWKNKSLMAGITSHLILQVFYAWMVVYTPIYLHEYMGFSWQEIGVMFTIMLLPFVLFEIPIGYLSDKKYGEKEIMVIGFFLIGVFTFAMAFIPTQNFILWTFVLFMSRVGASAGEITTESYFFKHVKSDDTDIISIFRTTRPLSFMIAPALAGLVLIFVSFQYTFIALALLLFIGSFVSTKIVDTR